jgi:hypothetical protein
MNKISGIWNRVERSLFPLMQERLPSLTAKRRDLALALETIRIEDYVALT